MFVVEKFYNIKKNIKNWWRMYFTVEGTYTSLLPDSVYLKKLYKQRMNTMLNLKNPVTYTEKLNWLKIYDRREIYTTLVDKYEVRKYVAEKIGEQYLVPLLNCWDKVENIDFATLPDRCVLKCNHDNGVIILGEKYDKTDVDKLKKELQFHLNRDYYKKCREWPYKNIKRKIICEQFMENTNGDRLVDYKVFCFGGEPKFIMVNSNRFGEGEIKVDMYDMNWEHMDMQDGPYPMAGDVFEKPECFDEMCQLARKLSQGMPTIRVDFNYWNRQLYFGELTFFHMAGLDCFRPAEWDVILGGWTQLPKR